MVTMSKNIFVTNRREDNDDDMNGHLHRCQSQRNGDDINECLRGAKKIIGDDSIFIGYLVH